MVGRGKGKTVFRRSADRGNEEDVPDPRDIEIERLRQHGRELEVMKESADESDESTTVWDEGFGEEGNPFGIQQPRNQPRFQNDLLHNLGIKIEIPDCDGIVAIKLRKTASLWWEHVKNRRRLEGKSKVETWEKMKWLLVRKFLPMNHQHETFSDYHQATQGNMSSESFIGHFDQLRMRCAVDEEEEQTIARFLGAIKTEIADAVHLHQYVTYDGMCRLALKVEKEQKNRNRPSRSWVVPVSKSTPVVPGKRGSAPASTLGQQGTSNTSGATTRKRPFYDAQTTTLFDLCYAKESDIKKMSSLQKI
uniref:Retrotransposon gag domain-containing protein n=1 Tax=Lactuca sativa TaxID=4236 RepID=A0A9R1XI90_LACSA|nr:hypothetical protein LSAT_V11C400194730 [Lactuca sativa]